ncbi:MAG: mycofactocin system glycosyltransferase [Acidimicrobium sp.]|nr:MAG: mycofactocin system glycosyltransferase [Acidimicrobium sp.]
MTSGVCFIADSSWRRPANGNVVLAGSPLTLFSLSQAGQTIAECIERAQPLPQGHEVLTERLLNAGAIHPVPSTIDSARFALGSVTAVIPAYIRTAHDAELLKSLVASCSALHGVVVIDDCSPHPLPDLGAAQIIRLEKNSGPAVARNEGFAHVTTDFVACIDVDVSISDTTITKLLPYFADDKVALVAPRVKSRASTNFLGEYEVAASVLDMGESEARVCSGTRVSYVPSAMWLCRTTAVQSVSGFDESLRSGEDVDMVWRLSNAGWRCRYQPQAECSHLPRATLQQFVQQRMSYGESAASLAKRHTGKLAPAKFNVWQASTWLLVLLGMPFVALGVAVASSAATTKKLRRFPQLRDESIRISLHATAKSAQSAASLISRVWWPIAFIFAIFSQRLRILFIAAALAPAVYEWWIKRPHLDVVRFALLKMLDNAAYGAGVWKGAIATRNAAPLIPTVKRSAANEE